MLNNFQNEIVELSYKENNNNLLLQSTIKNIINSFNDTYKKYCYDFLKNIGLSNNYIENSNNIINYLNNIENDKTRNLKKYALKKLFIELSDYNENYLKVVNNIFKRVKTVVDKTKKPTQLIDKNDLNTIESILKSRLNAPQTKNNTKIANNRIYKTFLLAKFLYSTGARISEALSIKTKDIIKNNQNTSSAHVLGKGSKKRVLIVENELLSEILSYYNNGSEYLFHTINNKQLLREGTHRSIKNLFKLINLRVKPHGLRHSCGHNLNKLSGFNTKGVSILLGHSNIETTLNYYVHNEIEESTILQLIK